MHAFSSNLVATCIRSIMYELRCNRLRRAEDIEDCKVGHFWDTV